MTFFYLGTTTTEEPTTESCICPCSYPAVPMYYSNNTYIAFMFKIEPPDIFHYCKYFGGKPFAVGFPKSVREYVLAYIRLTLEHCQPCCTDGEYQFSLNTY